MNCTPNPTFSTARPILPGALTIVFSIVLLFAAAGCSSGGDSEEPKAKGDARWDEFDWDNADWS